MQSKLEASIFPSALGWMAMVSRDGAIRRLSFGHAGPEAARKAVAAEARGAIEARSTAAAALVRRLQAYAAGHREDFRNVRLDLHGLTEFQGRVFAECRKIPYGRTCTYGQLAARVGSPGSARAVGNCMAANPLPLLIPCHRVVPAGKGLGAYSAPGGAMTKRRLILAEKATAPAAKLR